MSDPTHPLSQKASLTDAVRWLQHVDRIDEVASWIVVYPNVADAGPLNKDAEAKPLCFVWRFTKEVSNKLSSPDSNPSDNCSKKRKDQRYDHSQFSIGGVLSLNWMSP